MPVDKNPFREDKEKIAETVSFRRTRPAVSAPGGNAKEALRREQEAPRSKAVEEEEYNWDDVTEEEKIPPRQEKTSRKTKEKSSAKKEGPRYEEREEKREKPQRKKPFFKNPDHTWNVLVVPGALLLLFVFFTVCLIMHLVGAEDSGSVGIFGSTVVSLAGGVFGFGAVLFLLFIPAGALRWRHDVAVRRVFPRILLAFFIVLLVSALIYNFGMPAESRDAIGSFFALGKEGVGGGFLGGLVGFGLNHIIGKVGTAILCIAVLLLLVIGYLDIDLRGIVVGAVANARRKSRAREEARIEVRRAVREAKEARRVEEARRRQDERQRAALAREEEKHLAKEKKAAEKKEQKAAALAAKQEKRRPAVSAHAPCAISHEPLGDFFDEEEAPSPAKSAAEQGKRGFRFVDMDVDKEDVMDVSASLVGEMEASDQASADVVAERLSPVEVPSRRSTLHDWKDAPDAVREELSVNFEETSEAQNSLESLMQITVKEGNPETQHSAPQAAVQPRGSVASAPVSGSCGNSAPAGGRGRVLFLDCEPAEEAGEQGSASGKGGAPFISVAPIEDAAEDDGEYLEIDNESGALVCPKAPEIDMEAFKEAATAAATVAATAAAQAVAKAAAEAQSTSRKSEAPRATAVGLSARGEITPDMVVTKTRITEDDGEIPQDADEEVVAPKIEKVYNFPPLDFLRKAPEGNAEADMAEINENKKKLEDTLESFNVLAKVIGVSCGPRITRYELLPEPGVRVRSISNLVDDITMNMASEGIRIEAPIPGKAAVGVEIPNRAPSTVYLHDMIKTNAFQEAKSKTTVCLGSDVTGEPVYADIAKMPHLLVAGATGMGKSVCINIIITSILYKARPDEVKLILIDPKKVEFSMYSGIPHLLVPVVTDPQKAAAALNWAVKTMEERFDLIEEVGVRDIKGYNATLAEHPERPYMDQIVIIIDELNDLMLQARDTVETSICRIAQKARAAGIHLIIGTQRPSVDVITGVIKANIPSRIAFHVSQQVDSRTILDAVGAEKLLNNGDMLFSCVGFSRPKRVQGAFISDEEVAGVVEFLKTQGGECYNNEVMAEIEREAERAAQSQRKGGGGASSEDGEETDNDPRFLEAVEVAIDAGKVSTSFLQRKMGIGYGKAAKYIDRMQEKGIVSEPDGSKPRNVLITRTEFEQMRLQMSE